MSQRIWKERNKRRRRVAASIFAQVTFVSKRHDDPLCSQPSRPAPEIIRTKNRIIDISVMTIIDLYMARRRWSPLHFISKDLHIRRAVYTRRSGRELRADCCQFNPPPFQRPYWCMPLSLSLSLLFLSICLSDWFSRLATNLQFTEPRDSFVTHPLEFLRQHLVRTSPQRTTTTTTQNLSVAPWLLIHTHTHSLLFLIHTHTTRLVYSERAVLTVAQGSLVCIA